MRRLTSFRLADELLERIEAESRSAGGFLTSLVASLLDEGLKTRRFPGVVYRPGPTGRRAGLVGGPGVWEVVRDTVTAKNSYGLASAASQSAFADPTAPGGAPEAPTGIAASIQGNTATVSWTPPAADTAQVPAVGRLEGALLEAEPGVVAGFGQSRLAGGDVDGGESAEFADDACDQVVDRPAPAEPGHPVARVFGRGDGR